MLKTCFFQLEAGGSRSLSSTPGTGGVSIQVTEASTLEADDDKESVRTNLHNTLEMVSNTPKQHKRNGSNTPTQHMSIGFEHT
jgi:hypothetical protein